MKKVEKFRYEKMKAFSWSFEKFNCADIFLQLYNFWRKYSLKFNLADKARAQNEERFNMNESICRVFKYFREIFSTHRDASDRVHHQRGGV